MLRSMSLMSCLLMSLLAGSADAATVARGDLVVLDSHLIGRPWLIVVHPSGGYDVLARDGDVANATDVAVAPDHRVVLVTDDGKVVQVDPADGTAGVIASGGPLAAGPLTSVTVEPGGTLLVSQQVAGAGRILRVEPTNGTAQVLTASVGGWAGDLAIGAGGDLYVCVPNDPPDTGTGSFGSIARISRVTGAMKQRFVSDTFKGGTQISASRDGRLWVAHWGAMSAGYGGRLTWTDPLTGVSQLAQALPGCAAVAVDPDDVIYYQWQSTLQTGVFPYLARLNPAGTLFDGVAGPMAAVGADATVPVLRSSWGALKSRVR